MDSRQGNVTREMAAANADRLGINFDSMPHYPFWGALVGATDSELRESVALKVMNTSAVLKRECTQPEKDALAYHHAKAKITMLYGVPVFVLSAYGFYRRTYDQFGFPFYKPKPNFDPSNFFNILKGRLAAKAWHGLRFSAYLIPNFYAFKMLFASYALTVYATNSSRDPRLEEYRQVLMADTQQRPGGPTRAVSYPNRRSATPQDSSQGNEQYQDAYPSLEGSSTSQSSGETQRPTQAHPSDWPGMQQLPPERGQESFDGNSDVFDDTSSVAASQRLSTLQQPDQQQSAWDRIRNQSRAAGASQGQIRTNAWAKKHAEQTSRDSQDGSSYTYSSLDQEKSYAREQAQKEFDAMLEKERQGQSDDSQRR